MNTVKIKNLELDDKKYPFELEETEVEENGQKVKATLIKGVALTEGVWNGLMFTADAIERGTRTLVGNSLRINHSKDVKDVIAPIHQAAFDKAIKGTRFEALVKHNEIEPIHLNRIRSGTWHDVSAGLNVDISEDDKDVPYTIALEYDHVGIVTKGGCKNAKMQEILNDAYQELKKKKEVFDMKSEDIEKRFSALEDGMSELQTSVKKLGSEKPEWADKLLASLKHAKPKKNLEGDEDPDEGKKPDEGDEKKPEEKLSEELEKVKSELAALKDPEKAKKVTELESQLKELRGDNKETSEQKKIKELQDELALTKARKKGTRQGAKSLEGVKGADVELEQIYGQKVEISKADGIYEKSVNDLVLEVQ